MPVARYKTTIHASFDTVNALLEDKIEKPRKYISAVQHSKVLDRHDDHVHRTMYQAAPVPMTIEENIYRVEVPGGVDHVFERLNHEQYTGEMHNILTRIEGRDDEVQLEYFMDWHPVTDDDPMPQDAADTLVKNSVEQLKHLAENPPAVPDWVRAFYVAIDALDADALEPLLHENVRFRLGNNVDTVGKAAVIESNRQIGHFLTGMQHNFLNVDEIGDRAYVDALVQYTTHDGEKFLIPFLTKMERTDGKISAVLAYGDMSPLQHGW